MHLISPSPLKIKLQSTVLAEVLTPPTPSDKGACMIRVYDTNALWRHDEILRIRHMEAEIADMQKDIEIQKENAVAAEERFQRLMKEMSVTDLPKTGNCNQD